MTRDCPDHRGRGGRVAHHGRSLRRLSRLLASAIVVAGLVVPVTPAWAQEGPAVLRVGTTEDPETLNPFQGYIWYPNSLIYEKLVGRDATFQQVAWFAESWTRSDDGLVWTFKIAPDKKWSDGEPATARDVAFTFNFLLGSVGTENELALGLNNTNELKSKVESVVAVDDQTVQFTARDASDWLANVNFDIVPEHIWKDIPYADVLNTFTNDSPVGTGPFMLTDRSRGQSMRLERNPYYLGDIEGKQPAIDEVVFQVYDTADALGQALLADEIDFVPSGVPESQIDTLKADSNIEVVVAPTPASTYLAFNTWAGPETQASTAALRDPAFRDAIGFALDRDVLLERSLQGVGATTQTMVSPVYLPELIPDLSDIARPFDLEEAKRRLDAAGYVDSDGNGVREDLEGKELQLKFIASSSIAHLPRSAQFIVDWLGQIGVGVTPVSLEGAAFFEELRSPAAGGGNWDLAIRAIWPDQNPDKVMKHLTTASIGATNTAYWSNEEYDRLFAEQSSTFDPAKRQEIIHQMVRLAYEQAPQIYLYFAPGVQAYRTDRLEGWRREPEPEGLLAYDYTPELTFTSIKPVGAVEASPTPDAPASAAASPAASASASPAPGPATGGGGIDTGLLTVVGAVVVLVGAGVLIMRRRSRT